MLQLPNPDTCSLKELRVAVACCPDQQAQIRLNAILLLLCGGSFGLTLAHSAVSERCLQSWIKCFNDSGIDGITYRPKSGRPRIMNAQEIKEKILPLVDDPQRAVFVPMLQALLEKEKVEVFFGDESGFEGDPRPRQRWVKRGSNPTQGYYGGHVRQNIVGAVSPKTGPLVSLIVSHCDTEVFQAFLDTMAEETAEQKQRNCRVVLVLDNASWHKSKRLNWHHIEPIYLPPYSPDLNPIERIWQYLKGHGMAGYLTKSGEKLCKKLFQEVRKLLNDPETIRSVSKV